MAGLPGLNPDFIYYSVTFLAQIQWLFMTILWLNIFSGPTTTISGTLLYLKDSFLTGEDTKSTYNHV